MVWEKTMKNRHKAKNSRCTETPSRDHDGHRAEEQTCLENAIALSLSSPEQTTVETPTELERQRWIRWLAEMGCTRGRTNGIGRRHAAFAGSLAYSHREPQAAARWQQA